MERCMEAGDIVASEAAMTPVVGLILLAQNEPGLSGAVVLGS